VHVVGGRPAAKGQPQRGVGAVGGQAHGEQDLGRGVDAFVACGAGGGGELGQGGEQGAAVDAVDADVQRAG
jgi:hypothetical protein